MSKAVAIIAARGGSKRIPGKNIKPFFGKPMLQYSIEAAQLTGLFDQIVVSTDSAEIAAVAKKCGAVVPALRPRELADDQTGIWPVLLHALKDLIPNGATGYQYACSIMATSPFLQVNHLREGHELIKSRAVSSVLAVTTFPFPIFRAMKLDENKNLRWVWPEYEITRSQDLPECYHNAGQFVWFDVKRFLATEKTLADDTLPIHIPRKFVQDIDTLEDWETAECIYRTFNSEIKS